jgi:uncharacterized Zn finger protein (UPF0148 family)
MRCKNCGWENPEDNTNCEKCRAPLVRSSGSEQVYSHVQPESRLKKTIFETGVSVREESGKANICPQCGYPMRANDVSCPNCGHSPEMQKTDADSNRNAGGQGTVNPWTAADEKRTCTLTPVVKAGETADKTPLPFEGNEIVLTRKNTEKDNKTITTKAQAVLKHIDGAWHIEDRSELKTTFVHAGEMKPLKSGDIILLGNRQFIFNEQETGK